MSRLNYLVRSTATRRFLGNGEWVWDSRRADVFRDIAQAIAICRRHQLAAVELVLEFGLEGGRVHQLSLPVPEHVLFKGPALTSPAPHPLAESVW